MAGHACCGGVNPFPTMAKTLNPVRSAVICTCVAPQAIPHASAICSSGLLPSIALASSSVDSWMARLHISFMALTALQPSDVPAPRPSGGNSAFGFMYSPRIFAAVAYAGARYRLTQLVHPINCLTCVTSLSGAKSTMACVFSSSWAEPSRFTLCPSKTASIAKTCALLTP